jgi:hypothetical protein
VENTKIAAEIEVKERNIKNSEKRIVAGVEK